MKNFLIALVIAIILVNCLGSLVDSWLGMHLIMSDELLSPWENVAVLSLVGVVLAIVGFVVAVSVMGTILLALGAGFFSIISGGSKCILANYTYRDSAICFEKSKLCRL